jgi:hypothetical protein
MSEREKLSMLVSSEYVQLKQHDTMNHNKLVMNL